jgi:N-methylhydantoinase A/oxoprolinase/acetone carboxylase beta subunit
VEAVTRRVRLSAPALAGLPGPPAWGSGEATSGRVTTGPGRRRAVPVLARASLVSGQRVVGPAVLLQPDATTWLAPGWRAEVGAWGDLVLEPDRGRLAPAGQARGERG